MVCKGGVTQAKRRAGLMGVEDSLLKLLEPRQAGHYLHNAQHLLVLELVVLQTVFKWRLNPSAPDGPSGFTNWQVTIMVTFMPEIQDKDSGRVGDIFPEVQQTCYEEMLTSFQSP